MSRRKLVIPSAEGALVFVLFLTAACSGREAQELDAAVPDGAVPKSAQGEHHAKRPSLAVSGWSHHALHNFTMNDKQGRTVLKAKKITGTSDVNALKRGTFHVKNATMEGVEVTLYRDEDGALSLVSAVKKQPPSVRHGMNVPPTDKPKKAPWRMQIGPIDVKDATLTIGFTKKPVVFHIDSAKITVQRRDEDAGPVIYIHEAEGHMMKPKPLPKPVRIAWANGLVNLVGEPLVHLAARTCIRKSELRIDAIVEARKQPVLSLIHISEPTRLWSGSRMPASG